MPFQGALHCLFVTGQSLGILLFAERGPRPGEWSVIQSSSTQAASRSCSRSRSVHSKLMDELGTHCSEGPGFPHIAVLCMVMEGFGGGPSICLPFLRMVPGATVPHQSLGSTGGRSHARRRASACFSKQLCTTHETGMETPKSMPPESGMAGGRDRPRTHPKIPIFEPVWG